MYRSHLAEQEWVHAWRVHDICIYVCMHVCMCIYIYMYLLIYKYEKTISNKYKISSRTDKTYNVTYIYMQRKTCFALPSLLNRSLFGLEFGRAPSRNVRLLGLLVLKGEWKSETL